MKIATLVRHGDAVKLEDGQRHLVEAHKLQLESGQVTPAKTEDVILVVNSATARTLETANAVCVALGNKGITPQRAEDSRLGSNSALAEIEGMDGFLSPYKAHYKAGEPIQIFLDALSADTKANGFYEEMVTEAYSSILETMEILEGEVIFVFHSTLIEGVVKKLTGQTAHCLPGMGSYSINLETKEII